MKIWKIVIFECAVLAGIVLSAFVVPRDFPLNTFLMISASVLVGANILFFGRLGTRNATGRKHRMSSRGYLGLSLIALYWILYLLRH